MIEIDKKREATASIRGYFYQIDATLLAILDADLDDEVVIEGVEDFDRYSLGEIAYNQVKYCESQNLTNSVLREPLHKFFLHFYGLKETERLDRKYILYGHYKEINIAIDNFTSDRFKEVMTYFKIEKDKSRTKKSHLDEVQCSDEFIKLFCSKFEIRPAKELSEQRDEVVAKLRANQGVSEVEATGFHHPRAFDFVATRATKKEHVDRITSLRELQENLKGTQAIHHSWLLREKKTIEYARHMRKLYFLQQNAAGVIRVFIIEVDKNTDYQQISDQVLEIAKKWSSYKSLRTPNAERYAPFVMLRGAEESLLQEVKNSLYEQGVEFVDGYPYYGSPFRADHVRLTQTKEREIAVRLVNDLGQLNETLQEMDRKPRHIYDFFTNKPVTLSLIGSNIRGFSIPIEKITHIKNII